MDIYSVTDPSFTLYGLFAGVNCQSFPSLQLKSARKSHFRVSNTITTARMQPLLCCYRLDSLMPYDEDAVWALVQRHQGMLSIRGDCIDFWIPRQWELMLRLAYPQLRRQQSLDYV